MTSTIEKGLDKWLPRLVETWRSRTGRRASGLPTGTLTQKEIREIGEGVRTLSAGYTGARRLAGMTYLEDPALLGAYLLYYWPVSYVEARASLATARISGRNALDLGSGPGPAACALADSGFESLAIADHSPKALDLAAVLLRDHNPVKNVWDAENAAELPGSGYDCIILGNVLNELWSKHQDRAVQKAGLLSKCVDAINPGGFVCIYEPALKPVTRQLLQLRDMAVDRGYRVVAPCFMQDRCPAFALPEGTCHTSHRWAPPAFLRDLIRYNDAVKEEVSFSYLVLGKPQNPMPQHDPRTYRVVSDPIVNKAGRTRIFLCGTKARIALSAKRGERFPAEASFFSLKRGDAVIVEGAVNRGEGLALGPETKIARP